METEVKKQAIQIAKIKVMPQRVRKEPVNPDVVEDYADAMEDGAVFPPIDVFQEGDNYWLSDGEHRVAASKQMDFKDIECLVRQGSQRDAIMYALKSNSTHGLPRSAEDKRNAIKIVLSDPEWRDRSNPMIADMTMTSEWLVREVKAEIGFESSSPSMLKDKHGTLRPANRNRNKPNPSKNPSNEQLTPNDKEMASVITDLAAGMVSGKANIEIVDNKEEQTTETLNAITDPQTDDASSDQVGLDFMMALELSRQMNKLIDSIISSCPTEQFFSTAAWKSMSLVREGIGRLSKLQKKQKQLKATSNEQLELS